MQGIQLLWSILSPTKLLLLLWHLFLGGGSGNFTSILAHHGGKYFDYGLILMHSPWIMHVAWPKIIDAQLMYHWRSLPGYSSDVVTRIST